MKETAPDITIAYGNDAVGCFEGGILPDRPGRYEYMPYRSLSHLEMVEACAAGLRPRCFAQDGTEHIFFEIVALPEPHVMMVDGIERIDA